MNKSTRRKKSAAKRAARLHREHIRSAFQHAELQQQKDKHSG
jgi:hypothetical protein